MLRCSAVRLFGCSAVRLFGRSAVRLFGFSAFRLFGFSAFRLFGCGLFVTHRLTFKGGYGWVGGTVERHGWRERAYKDVLAACPAGPPVPDQVKRRRGDALFLLLSLLLCSCSALALRSTP